FAPKCPQAGHFGAKRRKGRAIPRSGMAAGIRAANFIPPELQRSGNSDSAARPNGKARSACPLLNSTARVREFREIQFRVGANSERIGILFDRF
ncbi:hypothetical protein, partial [Streptomyces sp. A1547]|uniref:hypothetical protein n=1 Tax=Streptomyces sp. A1547 TaxID=2563105 RepID=UPI0019D2B0D8